MLSPCVVTIVSSSLMRGWISEMLSLPEVAMTSATAFSEPVFLSVTWPAVVVADSLLLQWSSTLEACPELAWVITLKIKGVET